ncbi:GNAT family N-acetyltransferase [Geodermatophilus sp. SYSU D00815]
MQDAVVTADLLVHLVEPAAWRAALREGSLRPASLAEVGFVHLSTPDQVHLPAERWFPGRRDLALLVVDPARLPGPVRWEPGAPGDPAAMRFPHLYGPLPVGAVVAVVPWRPPAPPVLPRPDDALARALALHLSLAVRRAAEVRDVPGGVAVLDGRFPWSRDDNRLLLSDPVAPATVAATAAEVAGDAGWTARAATLRWAGASRVAQALAARGWSADELVLMARPAAPLPGGERAEVVPQAAVHELWDRSWREELARPGDRLDEVVAQLIGREARNDAVVAVTDVVVREAGRVVAAGQLRVDGATAAVESVVTDRSARGRGHADAVLARIVTLAAEAGCDLVVLEAAGEDWPRHWYARRGFAPLGSTWDVSAPQAGARTASSR